MKPDSKSIPPAAQAPCCPPQWLPETLIRLVRRQGIKASCITGDVLTPRPFLLPFEKDHLQFRMHVDASCRLLCMPRLLLAARDQAALFKLNVGPAQAK